VEDGPAGARRIANRLRRAFSRATPRVHLRGGRVRAGATPRDAHGGRTVSDGDDIRVAAGNRGSHAHVAAESRRGGGVFCHRGAVHVDGDEAREPEGSRETEEGARSLTLTTRWRAA